MSVEKNIESLQYQAKIMGHGNKFNNDIEVQVLMGQPEFKISGQEEYYQGTRKLKSEMNYRKGGENYFWNSVDATLVTAQGKETSQRFYVETRKVNDPDTGQKVTRTIGFTSKEQCNLLDSDDHGNSRSVCKIFFTKDGEPYEAIKKLNLNVIEKGNHPIESYPVFDIYKAVAKHKFKEDIDEVVESLCKGNLHAVTDPSQDKENARRFIALDAVNQDILIYDKSKKLIYQNSKEGELQAVKYRRDDDSAQTQGNTKIEQGQSAQKISTPANGENVKEESKEQLLSQGTANTSQDEGGKSHSKKKDQEAGDNTALIEKSTRKNNKGKKNDKSEGPPKDGPAGNDLMSKKRNSGKNKGAHV